MGLRKRIPSSEPRNYGFGTAHRAAATGSISRPQIHTDFETRSLPTLTRSYPRRFTFYVAPPGHSIETRSLPTLTHVLPPI
jgi:hypothetical protein